MTAFVAYHGVTAAEHQARLDELAPQDFRPVSLSVADNVRLPGEVAGYDSPGVGPSQVDMAPDAIAPFAYGGQVVTEVSEGTGGLVTSTATIARVIATHAVWDIGARQPATRYGEMDGTGAAAVSRDDGLDFAYAFSRRVTTPEHDALTAKIHDFLNTYGSSLCPRDHSDCPFGRSATLRRATTISTDDRTRQSCQP